MNPYQSAPARRKLTLVGFLVVIVVVLLAGMYYLRGRLEFQPPKIQLTPDSDVFGTAPLEISIADQGAGLKSVTVTLSSAGKDSTLAADAYSTPVGEKKISLALAKVPGVKEGPATLRVVARDASLGSWFRGNEAVLEKQLTIDLTPPNVELIADDRYINFGGVGAIVYKASPDTARSGVKVGDYFFPGFQAQVKDHPDHFFALFAHPYNAAPEAKAVLVATDKAGNTRELRLAYELKNVKYKKSTIALTDNFLQNKVAPLLADAAARQGSPKDVFVAVNKRLRKENEDKITAVTTKSSPSMLWKGAFTQLSNSKVEANFADLRTYVYNGEPVDTAYHLGYDLSVTKHYPVEAANSGTVAFAGDLGIYGNCVILDHGLGLFTLYGHMSSIDVKAGDAVQQRQALGKSGETGLAAGDHVHFGVYLDGVAVLPVEWWDAKWITDNIQPKLEGRTGDEIATAQAPKKKARSGVRKRRR
ncbi:MAG TPA: M23 family metallopeptidase [Burkholderiales bacterium]